jgi:hypothetical protein
MLNRPLAVVGYFFDLSFIFPKIGTDIAIVIEKSTLGITTETETLIIENPGNGIIRVPFTPETGFDQYCLKAYADTGSVPVNLASGLNAPGSGEDWTLGANPSVTVNFPLPPASSNRIYWEYDFITDVEYTVTLAHNISVGMGMSLIIMDDSFNTIESEGFPDNPISITFTATELMTKIGFTVTGNGTITLSSLTVTSNSYQVTEQICIDIIEECGTTFTNDDLRITQNDFLRQIE